MLSQAISFYGESNISDSSSNIKQIKTAKIDTKFYKSILSEKDLDKLIDVRGVCDITEEKIIARELALIKVQSTPDTRSDIIQIAQMFRAHIVDVGTDSIVVEVTGSEDKIAALQDLLNPYTVIQMMRTGRVAMTRGNNKEV